MRSSLLKLSPFHFTCLSAFVAKKRKNPSLIVSEGKEHNGKLVPYVTGRISEAGAASPRASVPYAVRNSNVSSPEDYKQVQEVIHLLSRFGNTGSLVRQPDIVSD